MRNTTRYKIEHHVPITRLRQLKARRYPLTLLKIADSFVVPLKEVTVNTRSSLISAARYHKITVTVRKESAGGLRVWRIK